MSVSVYILDLLAIGLLLLAVTLGSGWISRLPLSFALIYLVVGILLGPYGTQLVQIEPQTEFLEHLTEFVVIVSLYSCGLKMNRPLQLWAWNSTARLIWFLMPLSILAVAAVGHWLVGLGWGAAVLLGAILAPTDPVLASEVQLVNTNDQDELRFGLTSEGGLNDALAFPFVYFGLYWLKDSNLDNWFGQWVAIDLIWAIVAGIAVGVIVSRVISGLDRRFRKIKGVEESMEDFVALSAILLSYSVAEIINGYGFLAVFVAGVMTRRARLKLDQKISQLEFTERIEKLLEIGTILLLGSMLRVEPILTYGGVGLLVAGALLFIIRPVGAWISTFGDRIKPSTRLLYGWFGIRGVGSLYYLSYAFGEGVPTETAEVLGWITYITIVISVVLHGISTTPLMKWYLHNVSESRVEDSGSETQA
ncbi:sodium:proton antiporter [Oculatella sp. LEGE 06141]|uniref:cation:proton antiporter n=1 Tax=Oculatella sp. LEGE 06141 TaxID=1828648 RepID=UPI00187FFDA0|nr:sodium:proton antiporter [Oculatella sp. LEGE 06141]MBE9177110.1 sodium:proton antiporter [Oculatella sp. LEGE 06141]